ncbi:hypothetical protein CHELA1G11_13705 [Hyphomicrobiales bacterium]|nr:hypothetical protein CHELA1G2_10610 [Hyphomicrobiales bacterium]CAH1673465.1 hypothetical protein CHELA1G11_13705 [Hyphomicrobiales bacterium]
MLLQRDMTHLDREGNNGSALKAALNAPSECNPLIWAGKFFWGYRSSSSLPPGPRRHFRILLSLLSF